jgi:hypothetical protein
VEVLNENVWDECGGSPADGCHGGVWRNDFIMLSYAMYQTERQDKSVCCIQRIGIIRKQENHV